MLIFSTLFRLPSLFHLSVCKKHPFVYHNLIKHYYGTFKKEIIILSIIKKLQDALLKRKLISFLKRQTDRYYVLRCLKRCHIYDIYLSDTNGHNDLIIVADDEMNEFSELNPLIRSTLKTIFNSISHPIRIRNVVIQRSL